ncbi:hypothetical protein SAMN05421854_1011252 [Amycolatopsis rubida]|uniref:Uncharacterized protein n=1 Tax=Amycolatopsis rubida TaxID=112413 RepID=A0A1I5FQT2_9PSEU|nr:hypothetical protein SAMN05421854_1011252 [Amycolatopsis rubida]
MTRPFPSRVTVSCAYGRDRSALDLLRVHIGEDEMPARGEDPGELRDHRSQVRHVRQRETAQHDVLRTVVDRKFMQVSDESRVSLGVAEHLGRTVNGDDVVAAFGQKAGETSGAAGSVERMTGRDSVEDRREVGLVSEGSVLAGVIRGGPTSVTILRGELRYLDPLGQVVVSKQRADLS